MYILYLVLHVVLVLGLHIGYYMSAPVLLNLLNELGKNDTLLSLAFYHCSTTLFLNSIIHEHEC